MDATELKTMLEGINANMKAGIDQSRAEWKQHYEELKQAGASQIETREMVERALKRLDSIEAEWTRKAKDLETANRSVKSLGEMFTESEQFLSFKKLGRGTALLDVPGGSLFPVECGITPEFKTTITSAAVGSSTPGILVPQRLPGIDLPKFNPTRVRDLMNRTQTNNNAIEWVKVNVFTNAASPTAETISKPESAITFAIDSSPVRTVAHWIPAAKQILDDFAELQNTINTLLMEGLRDVEDYELVAGDGTGQHLSGLSTEATAYDTARNVTGDTYIDKINHAICQIEVTHNMSDGVILNPEDWRKIQLIKEEAGGSNTGSYLLGGPQGTTSAVLWGLPVATTTAVTRGTFYVGAFRANCTIHDRMGARIDVSTEHADFFIRNMVAIRAEERLAFTVRRSDAVVYGSF